jgi:hypothetical protein
MHNSHYCFKIYNEGVYLNLGWRFVGDPVPEIGMRSRCGLAKYYKPNAAALISMKDNSEGRTLFRDLVLDGFATYPANLYEPIHLRAERNAVFRP